MCVKVARHAVLDTYTSPMELCKKAPKVLSDTFPPWLLQVIVIYIAGMFRGGTGRFIIKMRSQQYVITESNDDGRNQKNVESTLYIYQDAAGSHVSLSVQSGVKCSFRVSSMSYAFTLYLFAFT